MLCDGIVLMHQTYSCSQLMLLLLICYFRSGFSLIEVLSFITCWLLVLQHLKVAFEKLDVKYTRVY